MKFCLEIYLEICRTLSLSCSFPHSSIQHKLVFFFKTWHQLKQELGTYAWKIKYGRNCSLLENILVVVPQQYYCYFIWDLKGIIATAATANVSNVIALLVVYCCCEVISFNFSVGE